MSDGLEIVIETSGDARCVYAESIPLENLGRLQIQRVSHVEPNADGRWTADLSPVGGPLLGPYGCRSSALQAEREWLARHWLMQAPL